MKDLAQNKLGQRETLVAVPFVLDGLNRSEEFPIALVGLVPLCERLVGIVFRQDDQVGRIEDAVLVFDQKSPHLVTLLDHEVRDARCGVDRKIGIARDLRTNVKTISGEYAK